MAKQTEKKEALTVLKPMRTTKTVDKQLKALVKRVNKYRKMSGIKDKFTYNGAVNEVFKSSPLLNSIEI